jgi:signal transduction histidine kinase/DNA-binding response OmpR family regulator
MAVPLVVFHFYPNNIENYAFFSQLSIVLITSIKVYFMGGMMYTGTPVFVGLIAPVYALILPNKKRAVIVFLLFTCLMIIATLLNPYSKDDSVFATYILGFLIGVTVIFSTLYYFTSQLKITKLNENKRVKELDELKTKFFTHIAHEFRAPLSIIVGAADQMIQKPKDWIDEGHDIIIRNSNNLIKLSNKLLELSKLETNSMPMYLVQDNITIYLHYLIESFHSLAESKSINLKINCLTDDIIMDFDPDKVQDIISNLLSNAIKFTPKNGSITVSISTDFINYKKHLIIAIKDTGIGIPSEQINTIFNRYYQAKNHLEALEEGTGLGLALTQEFVKLLGGNITVRSQINKGSIFSIQLPINNTAKQTHLTLSLKNKPNNQTKKTKKQNSSKESALLNILIVEDNEDVHNYLSTLLFNNYNIIIANNGNEGLEQVFKIIPDIIISDVMMPGYDGFTFCKKLKQDNRTSHIPIILITALADQKSKIEGLAAGADAYLTKPFAPNELFMRIDKLIALRKSLQEHYSSVIKNPNEINLTIKEPQNKEDSFLNKVRFTLEEHITDEEFGITQLCSLMAMSRSQLYRKFSSLTDLSVHQFIMTLKLQRAKKLLLTTDLNVSQVAFDTGFKNISHFSRVFTKEFGYNPSKVGVEI